MTIRISRLSESASSGATYLSPYSRTARPVTISPLRRLASCTWLRRERNRAKSSRVANDRSAKPRSSNPNRRVKTSPTCGTTETRATPKAMSRLRSRPNLLYPPRRYLRTPYTANSAATMIPAKRTCSAVTAVLLPRNTCRRDCIERAVKCKLHRRKSLVSHWGAAIRMAAPEDLVKLPACTGSGTSGARRALRPDPGSARGARSLLPPRMVLVEASARIRRPRRAGRFLGGTLDGADPRRAPGTDVALRRGGDPRRGRRRAAGGVLGR